MAYEALIDKNLSMALRLLKDLAVEARLYPKSGGFDFNTASALPSGAAKLVKVVMTDVVVDKNNVTTASLVCKTRDLGDARLFSTVEVGGARWNISEPLIGNRAALLKVTKIG